MNTVEKYAKYVNTSFVKAVEPVVVARAAGSTVTGEDGKTYTDLYSGIAVVNAGHCNPEVAAAAKAQIDRLVHCCSYVYHVPAVADLAEKLAQITPGRLQKSFFGNGQAVHEEAGVRRAAGLLPRPEPGDPLHHRKRRPQARRRAVPPGSRVPPGPVLLPLPLRQELPGL
jgi:4-aminobutyrate aminotransferase-like enzyme